MVLPRWKTSRFRHVQRHLSERYLDLVLWDTGQLGESISLGGEDQVPEGELNGTPKLLSNMLPLTFFKIPPFFNAIFNLSEVNAIQSLPAPRVVLREFYSHPLATIQRFLEPERVKGKSRE